MTKSTKYRIILELENKDRGLLETWLCNMPTTVGRLYYYGITEVDHHAYYYNNAAQADAEGRD